MLRRDDRARLVVGRSGDAAARRSSRRRRPRTSEMPMRSSTRAIAASMFGASDGCTQPSSTSILRACRGAGHAPAARAPGMRSRQLARQQPREHARRASAPSPNSAVDSSAAPQRPALRRPRPACARPVARRCLRPMSSSRPYCTPDGQVVSQLRQVRQRSRCSCVFAVTGAALEHLLDQVDAPARAVELVAQQLVGRARRRAEAAMHARAQDRVGLAALAACRG